MRKTETIQVRLTKKEKAAIKRLAMSQKLTLTAYILAKISEVYP